MNYSIHGDSVKGETLQEFPGFSQELGASTVDFPIHGVAMNGVNKAVGIPELAMFDYQRLP